MLITRKHNNSLRKVNTLSAGDIANIWQRGDRKLFVGSNACVCGEEKSKRHSFCYECYYSLPQALRDSLSGKGRFIDSYYTAQKKAEIWLKERTKIDSTREIKCAAQAA